MAQKLLLRLLPGLLLPALSWGAGSGFALPARQQCDDGDVASAFPAFPHGHFVSWGHCEHIGLASMTVEQGNVTIMDPITNTTCEFTTHGDLLYVTHTVIAPDFVTHAGHSLEFLRDNVTFIEDEAFNTTALCQAMSNTTLNDLQVGFSQHNTLIIIQQSDLDERIEVEHNLTAEINNTMNELQRVKDDVAMIIEHLGLQQPPSMPPASPNYG